MKDIKPIIEAVKEGALVLTVNTRLGVYLRSSFDSEMLNQKKEAWATPEILKLESWLERLWAGSEDARQLLTPERSKALWERVVTSDRIFSGTKLLFTDGVVSDSYFAYTLANRYLINLSGPSIYLTPEASALKRWQRVYSDELKLLRAVDPPSLWKEAERIISSGEVPIAEKVVFSGFDRVTPANEKLVAALKSSGVEVTYWPDEPKDKPSLSDLDCLSGRVDLRKMADEREEVTMAARFARAVAAEDKSVAILAPDLGRYSALIESEFRAELEPGGVLTDRLLDVPRAYNAALNKKLSEHAIVKSALDILSIDGASIELGRLFPILTSPYFAASDDEALALARIESALRRENRFTVTLKYLSWRLSGNESRRLVGFKKKLTGWIESIKNGQRRELPSAWSNYFALFLAKPRWPSLELREESAEYQALVKFRELLKSFGTLDDIVGLLSRTSAIARLKRMAAEVRHQSEGAESLIKVMDTSEATVQEFDAIWILGAHDGAFPRDPSPNPFLPLELQRSRHVEHSSFEVELDFSIITLKRLITSIAGRDNIIASFPDFSGDKERRPSRLIERLSGATVSDGAPRGSRLKDMLFDGRVLEDIPKEGLLPPLEGELLLGGASLLRDFSACPFKAFASYRLLAKGIDEPEPGLSPMERGVIVHEALELFWKEVGSGEALHELFRTERIVEKVRSLVNETLKEERAKYPDRLHHLNLEARRVEALLIAWLTEVELKRGDFTVLEVEKKEPITVGGLKVDVKIDRIDSINGGQKVLIDYKSGSASTSRWLPPRPIEPQVPLYTMTGDFDGVAFAVVRPGEHKFKGVARDVCMLPGVKSFELSEIRKKLEDVEGFDELLLKWRESITALGEGILSGNVQVDPAKRRGSDQPCKYCDFATLCRVLELKGPRAAWVDEDATRQERV